MPALSDYTSGTITLTNGLNTFTGTGTGWEAADFREGDTILGIEDHAGVEYVIATIDGNGSGTLTQDWEGATGTYTYRMRYMADGARVTAQARNLIELLGNGNLQSLAGLPLAPRKVLATDATGDLIQTDLQDWAKGMLGLVGGVNELPFLDDIGDAALTALTAKGRAILATENNSEILTEIGAQPAGSYLVSSPAGPARSTIGAFGVVRVQYFSASGTYTPHPNMVFCVIECFGAGGGGGGVAGNAAYALGGGGGGGGGYSRKVASRAEIGTSKPVTSGAGGGGGTGDTLGGTGGATSVGTLCVANGGSPGAPGAAAGRGGSGAAAGVGDFVKAGAPGANGTFSVSAILGAAASGAGGGPGGGNSVGSGSSGLNGNNAIGPTGGGSGASSDRTAGTFNGGAGWRGVVLITEFCTE